MRILKFQAFPILAVTVLLFVVAALAIPQVLSPASLAAMIAPAAVMAVAAAGQTLVVQQKGIDLSVGGVITLSAVTFGVTGSAGAPLWLSFVAVAVAAGLAGLLNGILVTKLHITPIIATLASNSLFVGAVWTISGGSTFRPPAAFEAFVTTEFLGFSMIVWLAAVLIAVTAVVMAKSVIGRRFTAVGANPATARASGMAVTRYIVSGYVASSLFAGLAGILLTGYVGSVTFDLGASYMLPVIAAVIVGGASLAGGRGSVVASAIACVFLSLIVQIVLTWGAPTAVQLLVQALALAVAATFRLVPWGRIVRRRRNAPPVLTAAA
jgi:ribose transport system permease protein